MPRGQHPWNTPVLQCCPGSHRKSFSVLEQFKNKYSNILWSLSQTRAGPRRRGKKKKSSLYTKSVLWQHGKTLVKLLKRYTWSNSSKVTTFPSREPKHYLQDKSKKKRLLHELQSSLVCLCPPSRACAALGSAGGPQELPGEHMSLGSRPPKLPKPLPALQDVTIGAIWKVFREIRETNHAAVMFCSGSTR